MQSPRARKALGGVWAPWIPLAPTFLLLRFACLDTVTCTAVTLYSGQFVAQSEFSVVITLAPLTGWWKVV